MVLSIKTRKPLKGKRAFYISDDLWNEFSSYAHDREQSASGVLCMMIRNYCDKRRKERELESANTLTTTNTTNQSEVTQND